MLAASTGAEGMRIHYVKDLLLLLGVSMGLGSHNGDYRLTVASIRELLLMAGNTTKALRSLMLGRGGLVNWETLEWGLYFRG